MAGHVWIVLLVASLPWLSATESGPAPARTHRTYAALSHLIVIYQENWSFDTLYHAFPGADSIAIGTPIIQIGGDGRPLHHLPMPLVSASRRDRRFAVALPVALYDLARFVPPVGRTGDLIHAFYHEQYQIDGGRMDRFVCASDNGGLALSAYDACPLAEGRLAREFCLCDHCFHSAFGGSFLNHCWLVAAKTPRWPDAPAALRIDAATQARVEALIRPGSVGDAVVPSIPDPVVTADGYVINTTYPRGGPHPPGIPPEDLIPPQDDPTIGDRLDQAGVDWAWYSGGWTQAAAGHADDAFDYNHQPFPCYRHYALGTPGAKAHLKGIRAFRAALAADALPPVSFIKPIGNQDEHPGASSLVAGQDEVGELVAAVRASPVWSTCAVVILYDENGGRWDHVAPPVQDRWGPGSRVPMIIVSPFARMGTVDHESCETVSILRLIEERWRLRPLSPRDAIANDLGQAFTASVDGIGSDAPLAPASIHR